MPSHSQNKEAVSGAKIVGCSETEAQLAASALMALSNDPEMTKVNARSLAEH